MLKPSVSTMSTELSIDSAVAPETSVDNLNTFMQTLIESGDLYALGSDAVIVYLIARNAVLTSSTRLFPSLDYLTMRSALAKDRVITALYALEELGYIQVKDDSYILREKTLTIADGHTTAEVTWDTINPGMLMNIREFRKVLVSGELYGAKIIHIDHLQVNVNNIQEGGIGVNSQPLGYGHDDTLVTNQTVDKLITMLRSRGYDLNIKTKSDDNKKITEINSHDLSLIDDLAHIIPFNHTESEQPILSVNAQEHVAVAEVKTKPIPAPSNTTSASFTSSTAPKMSADLEAQYQRLLSQYIDQAYEAHLHALQIAEKDTEKAYRHLIEHEVKRPKKPIGLLVLFKQQTWEEAENIWHSVKQQLQQQYDQVLTERQRLMRTLYASGGHEPEYKQVALQKLREAYPELCLNRDKWQIA